MLGLDQIAWGEFTKFILIVLLTWYALLLVFARVKSTQKDGQGSFEEYQSGIAPDESLQPIAVSANDYPSEILPVNPVENISLPASLYEETGYDEGLGLEHFAEKNSPVLAFMLPEIHYQQ